LLDTETTVLGVAQGKPRPELRLLAELNYSGIPDLRVIAGWGHAGNGGVTMPGKGKLLTRGYRPEEELERPLLDLLGKTTHDIYLNDTAYWRNVPEKVWDYTIGGYQVLKKWLSYREHDLLGRALTTDEAREVTHIARRLAALILLQPDLDANYYRVKAATHDWKL
jgi:Type ISP C-terminal specificity domain